LFVSISQVIGYKDCLQNDLGFVGGALNSTPTPINYDSILHRLHLFT